MPGDKKSAEKICPVKKKTSLKNISYAMIYECIKTSKTVLSITLREKPKF
jgi:hypothetical protein